MTVKNHNKTMLNMIKSIIKEQFDNVDSVNNTTPVIEQEPLVSDTEDSVESMSVEQIAHTIEDSVI